MDENVIPFRGRRPSFKTSETPEERAKSAERQAARIQDAKHAAILKKIKDVPIVPKPKRSEQLLRLAINLWQILVDFENDVPHAKRKVLYAAGQGSGTDSTNVLHISPSGLLGISKT